MFDVIFGAMEAWNLMGMLLMGGVFLLIGGGVFGYELYWRMNAQRITGRIISVRTTVSHKEDSDFTEERDFSSGEEGGKGKVAVTIFASLFILLPLIFIGIGANAIYKYYSLTSDGVYTKASVVRNEESYDSDNGTSYYAVLEFRDERGKLWEVEDSFGSSTPSFRKGAQVGVYYDEDDPERFVIDDFGHSVGTPLIFSGVGSLFIVVAGFMFFRAKASSIRSNFSGESYYPVYEYQGPNGDRMEHVASIGRNSLLGMLPGKDVRLLMFPDKPEKVRRPMVLFLFFGLCFLLPGSFILYEAVSSFEGSLGGLIVILVVIGFIGFRIRKVIDNAPEGALKEVLASFREQRTSGKGSMFQMSSGNKGSMIELSQDDIEARVKKHAGQAIVVGYIFLLIALGLSIGSYYAGLDMLELTLNGQRTNGRVVDMNSRSNSDSGYTYYAVVSFEDNLGNMVRFEDSVGSSHPLSKIGDDVGVLYDPNNSGEVVVDRGFLNWGVSGGMALGALALLLIGVNALRQGRANSGMKYRTRI